MLPFQSLHAIAARRGDGLHPELLRAMQFDREPFASFLKVETTPALAETQDMPEAA